MTQIRRKVAPEVKAAALAKVNEAAREPDPDHVPGAAELARIAARGRRLAAIRDSTGLPLEENAS